jgi:hypothetical protein
MRCSSTPSTCWCWAASTCGRSLWRSAGRLQHLLRKLTAAGLQFNEHVVGDGATVFEHACNEGIVSKHRQHPYRSGPSKAWLKIKNPSAPGVLRFEDGA